MSLPPTSGYCLTLRFGKFDLHLHWTMPMLGFWVSLLISNLARSSAPQAGLSVFFASSLSFIGLILVHEFGHAIAARLLSVPVHAIMISGNGGWCFFDPVQSRIKAIIICASGMLAQAVVLLASIVWIMRFGFPSTPEMTGVLLVLTVFNGLAIAMSAYPHGLSDGAQMLAMLREAEGSRRSEGGAAEP